MVFHLSNLSFITRKLYLAPSKLKALGFKKIKLQNYDIKLINFK